MLEYAYPPAEDRTLELRSGDFFREGLNSDLLVISAWDRFYEPQAGTMIAALKRCGITVGDLARALDFTGCESIRAWVSDELDTDDSKIAWPQDSETRFRRLAVIESPRRDSVTAGDCSATDTVPVFEKMFRLLALLPLHDIPCRCVATPLLNAGQQGVGPEQLIPGLIRGVRVGFDHVPELRELVIFDLSKTKISSIREAMLAHFDSTQEANELRLTQDQRIFFKEISTSLLRFRKRPKTSEEAKIIAKDILDQLDGTQEAINLIAIGISARKLIEYLVNQQTRSLGSDVKLFRRINYLDGSINPWIINALHTVRIFGNWTGHPEFQSFEERDRPLTKITPYHLTSMLLALRSAVDENWWKKEKQSFPIKRHNAVAMTPINS